MGQVSFSNSLSRCFEMDCRRKAAFDRAAGSPDEFGRESIGLCRKRDEAIGTAAERLNSPQRAQPKALRKLALSLNNAGQLRFGVDYTQEGHIPEWAVEREKILVVDDEEAIREVVSTLLDAQGYRCTVCANGLIALEAFGNDSFDLVLSDIVMPEMDGIRLLSELRAQDPDVPVIMVTAMHDISIALEAIRAGAYDYILKPFEKDQLFLSVRRALEHRHLVLENRNYQRNLEHVVEQRTMELKHALSQLEHSYDETLEALGGALDLKDAETEGHCKRVTAFTIAIAKAMKVDPALLPQISRAAFLHDIGKMAIPDRILRKPGPLDDDERAIRRTHCNIGYNIVTQI